MSMKNENEKPETPIYTTALQTDDAIYEMLYDRHTNTTAFSGRTILGGVKHLVQEVEYLGKKYKPLPPNNDFVKKGVILFPSMAMPYESEEKLLEEMQAFIHKYLDVSDVFEQIATYYVLFTWIYDRFNEVPYLRAIGDFGSGKSRFIQTIGVLCYKPVFTAGATTPSPIFRIINEVKGTLILDEADFRFSDKSSEIIKILNTGYQRGTPVLRSEGKGVFEVKAYDVFCPKIVATRETFTDKALESRFLIEEMGSSSLRADIPRTLDDSFYSEAESLRNKLLMWRLQNHFRSFTRRTDVIEGIHPRLNQIIIPLLTIINDEDIREKLKTFIIKYDSELVAERGLTWESDIVLAILKLECELKAQSVTVKRITDEVNKGVLPDDETLQARKVGWYLRTKLQLKSYKTRRGFVLSYKENRRRLDMWKERFGITDNDIQGERVNVVNDGNVEGNNNLSANDIGS